MRKLRCLWGGEKMGYPVVFRKRFCVGKRGVGFIEERYDLTKRSFGVRRKRSEGELD